MNLTLKQARALKGYTQAQLANALGVTEQTIVKYEKDPGLMRIAQAQRVAEALDVTFDGVSFLCEEAVPKCGNTH